MEYKIVVAILIFLAITFLVYRIDRKEYKVESEKKIWKLWGHRFYYWHSALLIGFMSTAVILSLLGWSNY